MKESFEKKLDKLEAEANFYEVKATFLTLEDLKDALDETKYVKEMSPTTNMTFPIYFLISKERHQLHLTREGHQRLLLGKDVLEREGLEAGVIMINKDLKITQIRPTTGSNVKVASSEDFPLIRKIAQRYLDEIKETK